MKKTPIKPLRLLVLAVLLASLYGCPVVRATGDTVEAVGQGAGHAIAGTGRAIERAAD